MTALQESQAITWLMDRKDHLLLSRVSWDTYETLLDEWQDRRFRHTYDRGRLEVMTRSNLHEMYKSLLGLFIVVLAEELNLSLRLGGELTLRRRDLERGLEPDQCYWIKNESRIRGKKELDFFHDPPPDLFVEVEITHTVLDRLEVLAALRVPEVWRFDGEQIHVGILDVDGEYRWGDLSPNFPGIALQELVRFLEMAQDREHLEVLRAFRHRVREQLGKV